MNMLKIRERRTKTNELRNKKVGSGQTGKGLSFCICCCCCCFLLLWVFFAARSFSLVAASRGFSLVEASLVTEHRL